MTDPSQACIEAGCSVPVGPASPTFSAAKSILTTEPAWRISRVLSPAQMIYDERPFENMPMLADALDDAGCDNAEILNHCRRPGEHGRGCWVVDLQLGKE